MCSVNTVPNLGEARAASRSASGTGASVRRISNASSAAEVVSVLMSRAFHWDRRTAPGLTVPVMTAGGAGTGQQPAGSARDARGEVLAHLGRRPYSAGGGALREVVGDRGLDPRGGVGQAQ